jgi:hypothetical protein
MIISHNLDAPRDRRDFWKVGAFNSNPRLQIQRLDLKALISLKAIYPFIVRNWRKATKGSIRVSKKCAQ